LILENEGLYQYEEGRQMDYRDKINNQKEIAQFVNSVFADFSACLTFDQYCHIIKNVSSEMFLSLMSLLH
jgi:hypothetical protein